MSRRLIKNTATTDKGINEAVKGVAIKEGPSTIKDTDVKELLMESVQQGLPKEVEDKTLVEVIPLYGEFNDIKNLMDNRLKVYNAFIKTKLLEANKDKDKDKDNGKDIELEAGGYTAKLATRSKFSFIEDALILRLKQLTEEGLDISNVVKVKEYVDMDELEKLIYNGVISASSLQDCQTVTESQVLTVKKSKK